MADGALGLEAAAEAARELRDAAAALAMRYATDEDALRRRAVTLDGDLRRLQVSVVSLEPAALDKVRAPFLLFSSPPSLLYPPDSNLISFARSHALGCELTVCVFYFPGTGSYMPRDAGWVWTAS
jgi:hypothetical protein